MHMITRRPLTHAELVSLADARSAALNVTSYACANNISQSCCGPSQCAHARRCACFPLARAEVELLTDQRLAGRYIASLHGVCERCGHQPGCMDTPAAPTPTAVRWLHIPKTGSNFGLTVLTHACGASVPPWRLVGAALVIAVVNLLARLLGRLTDGRLESLLLAH